MKVSVLLPLKLYIMRKMLYLLVILLFSTTAYAYEDGDKIDEQLYLSRIDSLNRVLAKLKQQLNYTTFDVILNDAEINQKILPTAKISHALRKTDPRIDSLQKIFENANERFGSILKKTKEYSDFISAKINIKKIDSEEYISERSKLIFKIRKNDPAIEAVFNDRCKALADVNLEALKEYVAMCKRKKIQVSIPLSDFGSDFYVINENPECFEIQQKINFIETLVKSWTSALYDAKTPKKKDEVIEPPKYVDFNKTLADIDTLNGEIKSLKYSLNYLGYRLLLDELSFKEDPTSTFSMTLMMATRDEEIKKYLDEYEVISNKFDSIRKEDSDFAYLLSKGFSQEKYPNITYPELVRRLYIKLRKNEDFCDAENEKNDFISKLNILALKKYVDIVIANHGFIRIDAISNKLSYTVKNSSDYSEIELNINLLLKKKQSLERSLYEMIK